jgi:hypothetical protein
VRTARAERLRQALRNNTPPASLPPSEATIVTWFEDHWKRRNCRSPSALPSSNQAARSPFGYRAFIAYQEGRYER